MNPYLQLFIDSAGLGLVISYCLWCNHRTWLFRQDLFVIRNNLWDDMVAAGTVECEDHRKARNAINAMIRTASVMSPLVMVGMWAFGMYNRRGAQPLKDDRVKQAIDDVCIALFRHTFKRTLLGNVLFILLVIIVGQALAFKRVVDLLNRAIPSGEDMQANEPAFC